MLAMPSAAELIIPSIVFLAAAWYFHRHLDEQDLPKGLTRGILVFTLASVMSFASGAAVSWIQVKMTRPAHAAPAQGDKQAPNPGSQQQE